MPGLLRGVARTAVIAGTASAVSGRVQRRQASRYAEQDAQTAAARNAAYQAQSGCGRATASPPLRHPSPASSTSSRTWRSSRTPGILTDAEFDAQKAKILAG